MRNLLLVLAVSLVLVACGKEEKKEQFTYDFKEGGCTTGEHKLDSKDAYCATLKDERANNFCAGSIRKQTFEANGCGTW